MGLHTVPSASQALADRPLCLSTDSGLGGSSAQKYGRTQERIFLSDEKETGLQGKEMVLQML